MNSALLPRDSDLAAAVVRAIHAGDVVSLGHLLDEHPELAHMRVHNPCETGGTERSLLHILTDWPANRPNAANVATLLIDRGADVNATFVGAHRETPLHWAASADDVAVIEVLLDRGANIEATGGVIGGGTALSDAVAFGQWKAARRLIERGARSSLWESAALGLVDRVQAFLDASPAPPAAEITKAFWCACHGGARTTAELLLDGGADINWIGYDHLTPLGAARRSHANELAKWLASRGAR